MRGGGRGGGMGGGGGRGMGRGGGGGGMGGGGGRGMGQGMGQGQGLGQGADRVGPVTPPLRETPIAIVAEDLCTGCGACIDACANGALSLGRPKAPRG